MHRVAALLSAALALTVAACLAESDTQLSDPGAVHADGRLLGTWQWVGDDGETAYLDIARRDGMSMTVVYSEPDRSTDDPDILLRYEAHGAELDGSRYLNLVLSGPDDVEAARRMIVRYSLAGNTLTAQLMDPEMVLDAVREGRLAGRLVKASYGSWPVIEDDRAALIAFIREAGADGLFSLDVGPFERVPDGGRQ